MKKGGKEVSIVKETIYEVIIGRALETRFIFLTLIMTSTSVSDTFVQKSKVGSASETDRVIPISSQLEKVEIMVVMGEDKEEII